MALGFCEYMGMRTEAEWFRPENIPGDSNRMREVCRAIHQVAASDTTVLIRGESGTGKELVPHAIHYSSPRARGPFVKVNSAALSENLLESELSGHEKGAFTGAIAARDLATTPRILRYKLRQLGIDPRQYR